MEVLAAGVAWTLQSVSPQQILAKLGLISLIANTTIPWSEFSARLSPEASVLLPDHAEFSSLASRWREWHAPDASVIVNVFTEQDVQETIRYANELGRPFVARSGGHGATEALAEAKNAIMIDLRRLKTVQIDESGTSATIGGGASSKHVIDTLWAANKQTVTGMCECVGFSAPVLGGGHGWLQGQHGLAADQVNSARLVLPNGEAVMVSDSENPDLFWALRGAGHNFGIVTEWKYKIYDVKNPNWSYQIFIFSGDKLEEVLELSNKMMQTQPPEVSHWMYLVKIPEIDPDHPVIWYILVSDTPHAQAQEYSKPIRAIGPMVIDEGEVPLPGIASKTMTAVDSPGCAKGLTGLRFPIGLETYDIRAVRKVFDEIDDTMGKFPEIAGSFFLLEGYSTQGVEAIPEDGTAFPHRSDKILVTSYVMYLPNAKIDPIAKAFGESLRNHLLEASGDPQRLRAYVNYAHGNEALEAVYGWEDWRLEKLKALKAKWDPHNVMRFYNPII